MSRIVTRGLKRQLELEAPQQPICEAVQPQKQTRFQVKGVQLIQAFSNEPQQIVTT
jgi:hypothetical protein